MRRVSPDRPPVPLMPSTPDTAPPRWCLNDVRGIVCTSGGAQLIVSSYYTHQIVQITVDPLTKRSTAMAVIAGADRQSRTVDGIGLTARFHEPRAIVFDRAPTTKPESAVFIVSYGAVRRMDLTTHEVTTVRFKYCGAGTIDPYSLVALPDGRLLVGCRWSLDLVDPVSGHSERLAGSDASGVKDGPGRTALFRSFEGLVLFDTERCVYACDGLAGVIRHITLPPWLFERS